MTRQGIRIIGGKWRRRYLPVVQRAGLRPTPNRVRETLFNWLQAHIVGARCLDLFAGSGALGFESLSRYASYVHFVEQDYITAKSIKRNLRQLQAAADSSAVTLSSAQRFLATEPECAFDIVFLDPPFHSALLKHAITRLQSNAWLAPTALVYLEQSPQHAPLALPPQWRLHGNGRAGQCLFNLYRVH